MRKEAGTGLVAVDAPSGGLWTVRDVARFWGVSEKTVYRQKDAGLIPFTTTPGGGGIRFVPDEIRALVGRGRRR